MSTSSYSATGGKVYKIGPWLERWWRSRRTKIVAWEVVRENFSACLEFWRRFGPQRFFWGKSGWKLKRGSRVPSKGGKNSRGIRTNSFDYFCSTFNLSWILSWDIFFNLKLLVLLWLYALLLLLFAAAAVATVVAVATLAAATVVAAAFAFLTITLLPFLTSTVHPFAFFRFHFFELRVSMTLGFLDFPLSLDLSNWLKQRGLRSSSIYWPWLTTIWQCGTAADPLKRFKWHQIDN